MCFRVLFVIIVWRDRYTVNVPPLCLCESVISVGSLHCYKQFIGAARNSCIILPSMYRVIYLSWTLNCWWIKPLNCTVSGAWLAVFPQRDSFVFMCRGLDMSMSVTLLLQRFHRGGWNFICAPHNTKNYIWKTQEQCVCPRVTWRSQASVSAIFIGSIRCSTTTYTQRGIYCIQRHHLFFH